MGPGRAGTTARWLSVAATLLLLAGACDQRTSASGEAPTSPTTPSPKAAPTPAPAASTRPPQSRTTREAFVIFVRPGESLGDIARWSGLSSERILAASGLAADARPEPWARLVLELTAEEAARFMDARMRQLGERKPDSTTTLPVGAADGSEPEVMTVTIRKNEMLGLLAEWAGIRLGELLAANPGIDPDRISAGQEIRIPLQPGRRVDFEEAREAWHERRTRPPAPAPSPDVSTPTTPVDSPSTEPLCERSYRLRAGDVVWKLANRWGVQVRDIRECNPGKNLDRVHAGEELRVPDAAQLP